MRTIIIPTLCILYITMGLSAFGTNPKTKNPTFENWNDFKSQSQQSKYISQILQSHSNKNLEDKKLRVVYFYPADRKPIKDHRKRWNGIMTDIQNFFRTEMNRLGYNQVTISLEKENGILKLHEVQGIHKDANYTYKSGGKIKGEVFKALRAKGINSEEETLLIVCGLSKTDGKKVTIYSPYYGMGANHNKGICFTADMEWLSIEGLKPDPKKIILQVKEHRGFEPFTLNRFNTVYIGGTIHELGHGLSLPHNLGTKKESTRGTALMGAGNYTYRKEWLQGKGSFLTHSSALRLLVHPLFRGSTNQAKKPPSLRYKKLSLSTKNGAIQINGTIDSTIPAVAMIAYNDGENKGQRGYMVNNNYDATSWTSVLNPNNEFFLEVGDLRDGNHQIRLVSVHINGAITTKRMHYSMKDGVFDFSKAKQEIKNILAK
ncbi:hypothetical protein [Candidatus Seribacter sulfatis]|uniref:hypothetical protein n=1 Tax=Candidatus Seribacter sulfatis TaxID=3381756 RepID=UPI003899F048